jgi:antitoxin component YwqK of YwqJK toxin-antitoxin module
MEKSLNKTNYTLIRYKRLHKSPFVLFYLCFALYANSQQFTTYELGDTINKFDARGMKTGFWEENSSGNLFMKGNYVNGQKDGMWITYFPNALIQKVENYLSDKLHGSSLVFDNRGMISEEKNL